MSNNLTKKLQNYTLLAVTGSLILNTGCKKDDEEKPAENSNVEFIDITDIVVDATTATPEEGVKLDINKDGVDDIAIYAYNETYEGNLYQYTSVDVLADGASVATRKVAAPLLEDGYNYYMASDLAANQDIKGASFLNEYGFTSIYNTYGGEKFKDGLQGKGDKYVGVKFKIGEATHYGWLKVNVDANGVKITVKEAAYNKVADETLKAGEK